MKKSSMSPTGRIVMIIISSIAFFCMFISIETRIWGNLLVGTFQCSNVVSECGCLNNYTHSRL